jgi:beta-glucanase (GH16 family)
MAKKTVLSISLTALFFFSTAIPAQETNKEVWGLVWADEFDSPAINTNNWRFDWGSNGWGNGELEYYTGRISNAYIEDGKLVIQSLEQNYRDAEYTSARMKTQGKQSFRFGKIAARMKLPYGQGIWPAFWLMGEDVTNAYSNWPICGEIDIFELVGSKPSTILAALHGPGFSGNEAFKKNYRLKNGRFCDDFHVFSIEWDQNSIKWFIDETNFYSVLRKKIEESGTWVFDKDFFLLMNTAVGGKLSGYPDETTVFPQKFFVDWIRYYRK